MLCSISLLLSLALCFCIGVASPNKLHSKSLTSKNVQGISQSVLDSFHLFENYTATAYCPYLENATIYSPINCPTGVCPLVEADESIILTSFGDSNDTSLTNVKGFVAIDPIRSLIVVAFAGSGASIRNWLTDFTFSETTSTLPNCNSCLVHSGFASGWSDRRQIVLDTIANSLVIHQNYSVVLTGHSIGGAVATLAGAELRSMGIKLDIYTFGSPRVGNNRFASYVTSQAPSLGLNFRVTHVNDPVPQLPPTWIGYQQISPEYWLANGTSVTDNYEVGDVLICEGIGNEDCNAGTGLVPIDGTAHDHYLGKISACQGSISW